MRQRRSAKKVTFDRNKYKREKYRETHQEVYYIVNDIPMNEDLWNFANSWIEKAKMYKDKFVYDSNVMLSLKRNKQIERRELTEAEKNGLRAAIVYIYNEMKLRGRFEYTNVYNKNIRICGNNLKLSLINQFLNVLTNQKMSANKQLDGKVLIDVELKDYYSQNKQTLVKVRTFKLTRAVSDKEIKVSLKLTPAALLGWNILSPEQMEELCNHLDDKQIKCYFNNYYLRSNAYKDREDKYKGFHLQLTSNEQLVVERYKNITVDYKALGEVIKNTPFKKTNVEYDKMRDVSYALATLTQRNITFKHGRIYYPRFTTLSTEYVDKVLFLNGKHLVELFDVKSCFVVMSMLLYAQSAFVDRNELKKLYNKVVNEDFYVWIGKKLNIKQDEQETFKEWRERCKQEVISWLFKTDCGKIKCEVDKVIEGEFSTYYNWLHSLEDVWDIKEKKNKCVLSVQCSWLENELILNGLFNQVKHLNTVTKHDAIYIVEDQYSEQLKQNIQDEWKNIINKILKGTNYEKENEKTNWY